MENGVVDCLIIGSGPAGYTAAIYAARAGRKPVMYCGPLPGGQLTTTTEIENFPGYPNGVAGTALMEDLKAQALRFGTDIRNGRVVRVDFSQRPFTIAVENGDDIKAAGVIICTGASAKYLGLPSERKFRGLGVSACATCDGFFYRRRIVAVVGGGDTACEEASYLAGICRKVYMIVRRDEFRASAAMVEKVKSCQNIEILWNTNTEEVLGDEAGVTGALLVNNRTGEKFTIDINGFFLAIGHHPNSELFKDWLDTDPQGYIITEGKSCRTNVPGVFAAGDVQDPHYRQGIVAAASGCMAAMELDKFLK